METIAYPLAIALVSYTAAFVLCGKRRRSSTPEMDRAKALAKISRAQTKIEHTLLRLVNRLAHTAFVKTVMKARSARFLTTYLSEQKFRSYGLSGEQVCVLLMCVSLLASFICWWFFVTPLGFLICLSACVMAVPLVANAIKTKEAQRLAQEMPHVFRTLAMALSSGMTLSQAIEYVGSKGDSTIESAFARSTLRLRSGQSIAESLKTLGSEIDAPGMQLISTALLIAQRTGSPLKSLFEQSASLVERQGEFERLLAVKTAQVRLSIRMVCILPILLLCGLSLMSPDFRAGLTTFGGVVSVVVAIAMDAIALAVLRKLTKGVV